MHCHQNVGNTYGFKNGFISGLIAEELVVAVVGEMKTMLTWVC
jgi:hypothetical protein